MSVACHSQRVTLAVMRTPALADTSPGRGRPGERCDVAEGTCAVEGCAKANYIRGWCSLHYQRWLRHGDPLGGGPLKFMALEERIAANTDRSGGEDACWIWTSLIDSYGYGFHHIKDAPTRLAHRLVYILAFGPIADDLEVDHVCHSESDCVGGVTCPHRRCVNPRHLEAVTALINVHRSRGPAALNAQKTHCLRGHPLSGDNLTTTRHPGGGIHRTCAACNRETWRRYRERKRAA